MCLPRSAPASRMRPTSFPASWSWVFKVCRRLAYRLGRAIAS